MTDEQLEEMVLQLLSSPITEPRYPLWAQTAQGQIVGYHYESVGYCFNRYEHRSFPGWHYHLLIKDESGVAESEIEVCEERSIQLLSSSN